MTTPSGQIATANVSSELGRLSVDLSDNTVPLGYDPGIGDYTYAGYIDRFNDYIRTNNEYNGYGNRLANGDLVTYINYKDAFTSAPAISPLSNNSQYYVKNANNTHMQLAIGSVSNTAVNLTDTLYARNGFHRFTRSSAPLSMNDERVRRLAGKTTGAISFSDLQNKSITKTYDTGFITSSRQRYSGGAFADERGWSKAANGMYYAYSDSGTAYNLYALDYFTNDTTIYANASIQSANLTFTFRISYKNIYEFDTYFGVIPFTKPFNYDSTAEPNAVTISVYGNQNDVQYLTGLTNTSSSGGYYFGDLVISYPLQTAVSLGSTGGWSISSVGQWNTSRLASTAHAVSISAVMPQASGGELRIHSCKMNGSYIL